MHACTHPCTDAHGYTCTYTYLYRAIRTHYANDHHHNYHNDQSDHNETRTSRIWKSKDVRSEGYGDVVK